MLDSSSTTRIRATTPSLQMPGTTTIPYDEATDTRRKIRRPPTAVELRYFELTPGELDGSEPIDDPPAGFAAWDEWRRHRRPPSV